MPDIETTVNIQIRIRQEEQDQDNATLRIQIWTNQKDTENPNTRDFAAWLSRRIASDYRAFSIELDEHLHAIESESKLH